MKREAAKREVESLDYYLQNHTDDYSEESHTAMMMAIKALEQEPYEDWYDIPSNEMTLEQARQAVKDLRKKMAEHLDQEPCGNVTTFKEDVLGKIRAEIMSLTNGDTPERIWNVDVLEIIDKYNVESGNKEYGRNENGAHETYT